jgi:hypothetical protein
MNVAAAQKRYTELLEKGFLGPSLKENPTLPSVGVTAARNAGVEVDDAGKMRCPDGTPGAGTFTDLQQSNCKVPNVSGRKGLDSQEIVEFKVGLFNTRTRLGRAGQAVGSYALPGDESKLRRPVRSAAARGLTPGGGGKLGPRLRGPRVYRCPPGFENGGRFTDSRLTTCGRRLFAPSAITSAAEIAGGPDGPGSTRLGRVASRVVGGTPGEGAGRLIEAGTPGNPVQISRNASIPQVGAPNESRRIQSLRKAESQLRSDPSKKFLIRRDGVALTPSVSMSALVRQKNNKDMEGGTIATFGSKSNFAKQELPVLLNSSAKSLAIVLPGSGTATVVKDKTPDAAQRRAINAASRASSGPEAITAIVEASGGSLSLKLDNVKGGVKLVRVRPAGGGPSRQVPEWVYETYLHKGAAGREGRDIWVLVKGE